MLYEKIQKLLNGQGDNYTLVPSALRAVRILTFAATAISPPVLPIAPWLSSQMNCADRACAWDSTANTASVYY